MKGIQLQDSPGLIGEAYHRCTSFHAPPLGSVSAGASQEPRTDTDSPCFLATLYSNERNVSMSTSPLAYYTMMLMSEHLPSAELFIMHMVESAFFWPGCVYGGRFKYCEENGGCFMGVCGGVDVSYEHASYSYLQVDAIFSALVAESPCAFTLAL